MHNPHTPDNLTTDSILGGRIKALQERRGYRFSLDAVLLSYFAGRLDKGTVVDLGTGCGIIPLILAVLNPRIRVVGVEIQQALADLARKNAALNGLEERIAILHHDLRERPYPGVPARADVVLSNPPYRQVGSGRMNPEAQKAAARHEITASLEDVAQAGAALLGKGGRMALVYPATRLVHLVSQLEKAALEPKRLRLVHSHAGDQARLALVEAVKGAGPQLTVEPPLFIYGPDGQYTERVRNLLYPEWSGNAPEASWL